MFKLRQKNFTLIELIVVILILGVLMRIAIPKFAETKHDFTYKADSVSAQSIIRQLESKVLMGMIDLENNKTVTIFSDCTLFILMEQQAQLEVEKTYLVSHYQNHKSKLMEENFYLK